MPSSPQPSSSPWISREYRGETALRDSGEQQAALQVVDPAVVTERHLRSQVPWQPDLWQGPIGEDSLVGQIVEGQLRGQTVERGVVPIERLEIDRQQRRLPLVDVEDARTLAAAAEVLEHGTREECEAQMIVRIIGTGLAVRVAPLEQRGVLDEHGLDTLVSHRRVEACAPRSAIQWNVNRAAELAWRELDRRVARQETGHAVPERRQRPGERARDVRESSRLHVGHGLRSCECDVEPPIERPARLRWHDTRG